MEEFMRGLTIAAATFVAISTAASAQPIKLSAPAMDRVAAGALIFPAPNSGFLVSFQLAAAEIAAAYQLFNR
jgi:hypothetical protein